MERFYEKLQTALDNRRDAKRLINPPPESAKANMIDFSSNDTLSLSTSRILTAAFLHQLETHPDFIVGSRSARSLDGTQDYLTDIEAYLAAFHGAETALFFNSGFDANVALWSTLPQPGDFVVHDEYVHASIHDGMRKCRAKISPFRHSDCADLRRRLVAIRDQNETIARGENHVFIALESFYSMDGDLVPIEGILATVSEALPLGNYLLSIDEAHSNGLVGPKGAGVVSYYGLEDQFAFRLATDGKALGSTGAAILCREVVKQTLINYSRESIFSTAPSFLTVSAVRAGYEILASEEGEKAGPLGLYSHSAKKLQRRHALQQNIHSFYHLLTTNKTWTHPFRKRVLYIPTETRWKTQPFLAPIIGLVTTQPEKAGLLADKLAEAHYFTNVVHFPIVPKGMDRIRLMIHADNTREQIAHVVELIVAWVAGEVGDIKPARPRL
ncbi:pyridoxal phosphate-dependent transferase [Aspergillus californicus]